MTLVIFQDPARTGRCKRRVCNDPLLPWLDREFCSRTCRDWAWAPLYQRWLSRADITAEPLNRPWHNTIPQFPAGVA